MNTEIKLWTVEGKTLRPLSQSRPIVEKDLEDWFENNPEVLGPRLLVISRQLITAVGRIDLLAIDSNSTLYLIELKRGMTPREVVAQALDYSSWLDSQTEADIYQIAERTNSKGLAAVFQEAFKEKIDELNPSEHKVLVVAAGLDSSSERIINYLAKKSDIDINAVYFTHVNAGDSSILARTVLVPDAGITSSGRSGSRPSLQGLLERVKDSPVEKIVDALRDLVREQFAWEQSTTRNSGSIRFITRTPDHSATVMIMGLNIANTWQAPPSSLDVWLRLPGLSKASGLPIERLRGDLSKDFHVVDTKDQQFVIRVPDEATAVRLTQKIKDILDFESRSGNTQP